VYTIKCGVYEVKKRSNAIDSEQTPQGGGDMQFRRWEYWGFSGLFILHYTGDHTVFSGFAHRNSRKISRPFIRSAPYVKEKVRIGS
jgi:hypothetical protein